MKMSTGSALLTDDDRIARRSLSWCVYDSRWPL